MRAIVLAAVVLSACVTAPVATTTSTLSAADAATSLAVGEQVVMSLRSSAARPDAGQDAIVAMTLQHADGRVMAFTQSNHAPAHIMAQEPGGPLAQTMGLFGEERPVLYGARAEENRGVPFICGPDGPHSLGYYEAADGTVQIVGLKQDFQFETRPDGVQEAVPYSPDQVCARLRFRKS